MNGKKINMKIILKRKSDMWRIYKLKNKTPTHLLLLNK